MKIASFVAAASTIFVPHSEASSTPSLSCKAFFEEKAGDEYEEIALGRVSYESKFKVFVAGNVVFAVYDRGPRQQDAGRTYLQLYKFKNEADSKDTTLISQLKAAGNTEFFRGPNGRQEDALVNRLTSVVGVGFFAEPDKEFFLTQPGLDFDYNSSTIDTVSLVCTFSG